MAFTLESQGRVRQRTREYNQSPAIFLALQALFHYLSEYKKISDLAFLPLTAAGLTTSTTGQVVGSGTAHVYAVYAKKPNTGTDAFLVLGDDATNVAGADAARVAVLRYADALEENFLINPGGITIATGIVGFSATTGTGTTLSSAADAPNGFVILGA